MISPNTPPGTDVVCIDDSPGRYGETGLRRGGYYTVDRIVPGIHENFVVLLKDFPLPFGWTIIGLCVIGFSLRRFRYLELPKELSSLQRPERIPLLEMN